MRITVEFFWDGDRLTCSFKIVGSSFSRYFFLFPLDVSRRVKTSKMFDSWSFNCSSFKSTSLIFCDVSSTAKFSFESSTSTEASLTLFEFTEFKISALIFKFCAIAEQLQHAVSIAGLFSSSAIAWIGGCEASTFSSTIGIDGSVWLCVITLWVVDGVGLLLRVGLVLILSAKKETKLFRFLATLFNSFPFTGFQLMDLILKSTTKLD